MTNLVLVEPGSVPRASDLGTGSALCLDQQTARLGWVFSNDVDATLDRGALLKNLVALTP